MRALRVKMFLSLFLLSLAPCLRAAEPTHPVDQEKSDKAQEDLIVQVDKLTVTRQRVGRLTNTDYDAMARVLAVTKTTAWVNAGDIIQIHYTREDRRKQGANNPPLPMKENTTYHVYLARNTWNNLYGPAIGERSFELVVAKKKPTAKTSQSQ